MKDGNYKNIEDLKIGDKVISYDFEDQTYKTATVKINHGFLFTGYYLINNNLKVMGDESIVLINNEWKFVKDLNTGDELFSYDGKNTLINSIEFN
jgi:hypothetical protein